MAELNINDINTGKDQVLYTDGDKIQFQLPDKNGKPHWFIGVIHGVKRVEDPKTNAITKITYLIDTGRDTRMDEYPVDVRGREIDKRVEKLRQKGKNVLEAVTEVYKHTDLPDSKIEIEKVRQPEQIELPESMIRKA